MRSAEAAADGHVHPTQRGQHGRASDRVPGRDEDLREGEHVARALAEDALDRRRVLSGPPGPSRAGAAPSTASRPIWRATSPALPPPRKNARRSRGKTATIASSGSQPSAAGIPSIPASSAMPASRRMRSTSSRDSRRRRRRLRALLAQVVDQARRHPDGGARPQRLDEPHAQDPAPRGVLVDQQGMGEEAAQVQDPRAGIERGHAVRGLGRDEGEHVLGSDRRLLRGEGHVLGREA